jgi:hypothetical protein
MKISKQNIEEINDLCDSIIYEHESAKMINDHDAAQAIKYILEDAKQKSFMDKCKHVFITIALFITLILLASCEQESDTQLVDNFEYITLQIGGVQTSDFEATINRASADSYTLLFNYQADDNVRVEALFVNTESVHEGIYNFTNQTAKRFLRGDLFVNGEVFTLLDHADSRGFVKIDSIRNSRMYGELSYQIINPYTEQQIRLEGLFAGLPL